VTGALRLGVVIPCRNEAAVIERRLRNLELARWPRPLAGGPHQVVVVDDGSSDGTAELARRCAARRPPFALRVVASSARPGKPGAVRAGLAALAAGVDLVVLTDADVVLDERALAALESAFRADARLAMASGAQRFVRRLEADGRPPAAPAAAAGPYDRATEAVRRLESRFGALFSVHGQLLAWRRELELAPTPGIAADDLDLMLQVRARRAGPRAVRLVDGAVFYEEKTPPGAAADGQALRRARAFVQLVRRCSGTESAPVGALARVQWAGYRALPTAAPGLALGGLVAGALAATWWGGPRALAALAAASAAALALPRVRAGVRLLALIARAVRLERRGALGERWEMARR